MSVLEIDSRRKVARIAGLLYLALIIFGIFAEFFVRSKLIEYGNAYTTLVNVKSSEQLFRIGFTFDLLMLLAYFFLSMVLYHLLESVNKKVGSIMVLCVLAAVAIMFVNMLHYYMVLLVSENKDYLEVFENDQRDALGMLFIYVYRKGYMIAQVFFGLWLLPLGYLVFRSDFMPRILGILLMVAGAEWMIDSFIYFLFPDLSRVISLYILLSAACIEFLFCFWLLFKGVKEQKLINS
ncbi:MAG: DUF4386 domain-containing protein [Bacteroidota bacterium]